MKRIIFLFLLSIVVSTHLSSQVEMRGTITTLDNDKPTPVEFANIVLYSASDTTKMIAGTVSDLNGNYLFEYLEMGRYHLVISYLGYKTLSQPMRVVMP